jgi:hypothetical protein
VPLRSFFVLVHLRPQRQDQKENDGGSKVLLGIAGTISKLLLGVAQESHCGGCFNLTRRFTSPEALTPSIGWTSGCISCRKKSSVPATDAILLQVWP